jgi:hypothetical protein
MQPPPEEQESSPAACERCLVERDDESARNSGPANLRSKNLDIEANGLA